MSPGIRDVWLGLDVTYTWVAWIHRFLQKFLQKLITLHLINETRLYFERPGIATFSSFRSDYRRLVSGPLNAGPCPRKSVPNRLSWRFLLSKCNS